MEAEMEMVPVWLVWRVFFWLWKMEPPSPSPSKPTPKPQAALCTVQEPNTTKAPDTAERDNPVSE